MPPVVAAIAGIASSIGFGVAASAWIGAFAVRVALSIGFSVLARALQKKPTFQQPGITNEATQTGGTDPQSVILGRYATGGQLVAPPMTHGNVGKTPNAYLTYVIAVCDAPGATLSRLFIDGEIATIGGPADPDYGLPVTLKGIADKAWVKWYDGTQTVADPMLLAKYGAHPERPWSADMVGVGTAYAILTFRFDHTLFKSFPSVRFEVDGIPLYDPRQDPAMGGTGTQSWASPATWTPTGNPVVMIYNILRGIALPGGDVWGGGWAVSDLPVADWIAAMNVCDEPVALAAGGTEPRYRAGLEVPVDQEPANVIEELLKTCAGRVTDVGGLMKIVAGPPGLPVKAILDEDIIITDEQSAALFPSLASTHNGVHASFPDPASLWESRDAPPRYDAAAEAEDGRRLIATVSMPACPYGDQVQRLMQAWIAEERRFRRHQLVLPPDAAILEPLDVISWTSVRNGYGAKLFEVAEIAHDPVSLLQAVSLREVDPADYDWNTSLELPWVAPVTGSSLPPAQVVPNFTANGMSLDDTVGAPRRPAILLTWDGAGQDDVAALEYELRILGGTQIVTGATLSVATGSLVISAGILPDTNYEVRVRFIAPRPVLWTAWTPATTPGNFITLDDFSDLSGLFASAGLSVPKIVAALPVSGAFVGELVYLTTDNKLYRWDGAGWTATVPTSDLTGRVATSQLVIADLSNLCEDPGFELDGAGWGAVGGLNGYAILSTDVRTGLNCAGRTYGGITNSFAYRNNMIFDARAGSTFRLSGYIKRSTDAVCTSAGVRIAWLSASGTVFATSTVVLAQASLTTAYQFISDIVTAPGGAVYGRVELVVFDHSAGTFFWDDVYCYRANGGELLVDGDILGNHIAANTLVAGLFAAGAIKANDMEIDNTLRLDAAAAGFSIGKDDAADFVNTGLYAGRRAAPGGGTGFGFLLGTTSISGVTRSLAASDDTGLTAVNMTFGLLTDLAPSAVSYTTSQTVVLGGATQTITMTLLGGGGGSGTAGGQTKVELYESGSPTGIEWTSAGGAAAASSTVNGQNSILGTGGAGASGHWQGGSNNGNWVPSPGSNATGYGAGGGGQMTETYAQTKGGGAALPTYAVAFDVSAYTAPSLVITVGAQGTGVTQPSAGIVKLQQFSRQVVPAGVIPFAPTATGQFAKAASATGAAVFPDMGGQKGMWVIWSTTGATLEMSVQIDTIGTTLILTSARSASFVAEINPVVSASTSAVRTIGYAFHRMSVED